MQPVITPHLLLRGQPTQFLEENWDNTDSEGLDMMQGDSDTSRGVERTSANGG